MDVIFSYPSFLFFIFLFLFLFVFFLPDLACSSPNGLPCPPPFDIRHPFTSVSSEPNFIHCNGSTLMIRFNNQQPSSYVVIYLTYDPNILIIQDQNPTPLFQGSDCDFIYVFEDPRPRFDPALLVQSLGSKPTIFNCNPTNYNFSGDIFNHSTGCSNYTIHYSEGSANQIHDDPYCLASQTPSFEWKMSFGVYLDDFPLLSAGSIHKLEVHPNCFNCHIKRENCSTDLTTGNSMCTCGSRCPSTSKGKGTKIAIGVGVGVASLLLGCCCFLLYQQRKRRQRSTSSNLLIRSASSKTSSMNDPELGSINYRTHVFSYEELQAATNGFDVSKELGDGGFGTVYKGELRDGRVVAVKRLYENNYKRVEQFLNEVDILSRLRHQNLVTLYGCTSRHSRELLLVYEFVPNGTVADNLHGPRAPEGGLTWAIRLNIAIETADALAYLHAVEPQIIHRDVKTNNILLDDGFHVKVADFGLSRLFPVHATHVSTLPQGTPGYVDPEYYQCYQLTDKSDVYSFGVVLVELISSKPAVDISRHRNEINLATMAITKIQQGELDQLVDPGLGFREDWETKRMITMVAELAFRCLQGDRDMRPCIKEVVGELRVIQGRGEKEVEADIRTKEDMGLLKNTLPYSPDSVTARWDSRLTTPNTSS